MTIFSGTGLIFCHREFCKFLSNPTEIKEAESGRKTEMANENVLENKRLQKSILQKSRPNDRFGFFWHQSEPG